MFSGGTPGTAAQRLPGDHLFARPPVVRLEADTGTGNVAEQQRRRATMPGEGRVHP
ncbi:hypothetical protein [Streptomyces abyssomicinicus]|uniref:hypothetical protein n=1 Tax=Streptomyces abyssomicinicus TaxID=574929 RepID=UPI0013DFA74E|nr:hypothetical protein [Streptomyces abyssomicinicus]